MNIVLGSGAKRVVVVFPCAELFKRASEQEQQHAVSDFCQLAGIKAA